MRPLTPKERKLSFALAAVAFTMANLFGLPWLSAQQKLFTKQITGLRSQQLSAESWLKEKDLWTERKAWLDANQPKLATSGDASSSFLESLQQSAKENKVKIVEQKLLDSEKHAGYQAISVRMTVNGTLDSIVKWLNTVQQPTLFQAVLKLNLKIEGEPPNMRCDVDLSRWYATSL